MGNLFHDAPWKRKSAGASSLMSKHLILDGEFWHFTQSRVPHTMYGKILLPLVFFSGFSTWGNCIWKTPQAAILMETQPHHPNSGSKVNIPHIGEQRRGPPHIDVTSLMYHLPIHLSDTDTTGLSNMSLLWTVLHHHLFFLQQQIAWSVYSFFKHATDSNHWDC